MGSKTEAAVRTIVEALEAFPREDRAQLLAWAQKIASGAYTFTELAAGTWGEPANWNDEPLTK